MTVQAKRASQRFIGQAERSRGTSLNKGYIHFVHLERSACPINAWLARFACVVLRKIVPKVKSSLYFPCVYGKYHGFISPPPLIIIIVIFILLSLFFVMTLFMIILVSINSILNFYNFIFFTSIHFIVN